MTRPRIDTDELRKLLGETTRGPWKAWQPRLDESVPVRTDGIGLTIAYAHQGAISSAQSNATLIALAPELADELILLREQAEAMAEALEKAEAALSDIGDAEREPGDDLAWCEARAAKAIMTTTPTPEAVNKSIAMCGLHGLHGTQEVLRALLARVDALTKELAKEKRHFDKAHADAIAAIASSEVPPAAQVTVAWELLRRVSTILEHHGVGGGLLADINDALAGEDRADG